MATPLTLGLAIATFDEDRVLYELVRLESRRSYDEMVYECSDAFDFCGGLITPIECAVGRDFRRVVQALVPFLKSPASAFTMALERDAAWVLDALDDAQSGSVRAAFEGSIAATFSHALHTRSSHIAEWMLNRFSVLPDDHDDESGSALGLVGLAAGCSTALLVALSAALSAKYPDRYLTANDAFFVGPAPHGQLILALLAQNANADAFEFVEHIVGRAAVHALRSPDEDGEPPAAAQIIAAAARCSAFSPKSAQYLRILRNVLADFAPASAAELLGADFRALGVACLNNNAPLVALLLGALSEGQHSPRAASAAFAALRTLALATSVTDSDAAPESAADLAARRVVDTLLRAAVGASLADLSSSPRAVFEVQRAIFGPVVPVQCSSPVFPMGSRSPRGAPRGGTAAPSDPTAALLSAACAAARCRERPVAKLLLVLALAGSESMCTHTESWREIVRALALRLRSWGRQRRLTQGAAGGQFERMLATEARTAEDAAAVIRAPGVPELAPEPLVALPAPHSEFPGLCSVCCRRDTACHPVCAALRDRDDIEDALLLRSVLAAAPDEAVRRALLSPQRVAASGWQSSLVHHACHQLKPSVLSVLLEAGADPLALDTSVRGCEALSPLHFLARPAIHRGGGTSFTLDAARGVACARVVRRAVPDSAWERMVAQEYDTKQTLLTRAAVTANEPLMRFLVTAVCSGAAAAEGHSLDVMRLWPDEANSTRGAPALFWSLLQLMSSEKPYLLDVVGDCSNRIVPAFSFLASLVRSRLGLDDDCRPAQPSEAGAAAVRRYASLFDAPQQQQQQPSKSLLSDACSWTSWSRFRTLVALLREGVDYRVCPTDSPDAPPEAWPTVLHIFLISLPREGAQDSGTCVRELLEAARAGECRRSVLSGHL